MTAALIDGKAFAQGLRDRVGALAAEFTARTGRKAGLAVVLVGEDPASQVYVRSKGKATLAAGMAGFEHRLPADTPEIETSLGAGELITAIVLPPPPPPETQVYRKVRDRASYAWGLASVALAGDRIVLGAVAAKPWRATAAEQALAGGAAAAEAIDVELQAARDNGHNGFKIDLVRRLIPAAITQAKGNGQ